MLGNFKRAKNEAGRVGVEGTYTCWIPFIYKGYMLEGCMLEGYMLEGYILEG